MQEALSRTLLELRTLVPGSLAEALTVTDLQQTRDEVARTLRGNKVSLEYIRLKAFEQTLSNLGHNDPELASHLTTFYLGSAYPILLFVREASSDGKRTLPVLATAGGKTQQEVPAPPVRRARQGPIKRNLALHALGG